MYLPLLSALLLSPCASYARSQTGAAKRADNSITPSPQGDTQCTDLLCVSAIVNQKNSTTTYVLQSTDKLSLGWMAIGFGSQMANTPMVIMWPAANGNITISQRSAPAEVMPTVVSNPPRVATVVSSLVDVTTTTNPKMAFSVSSSSDTEQQLIWAFSSAAPSSFDAGAALAQHSESGPLLLDLTKQQASLNPISSGSDTFRPSVPFTRRENMFIAHAVLCSIGFLISLPLGVFTARYLRLTSSKWFQGHVAFQVFLSAPAILSGFVVIVVNLEQNKVPQFKDKHQILGLILFVAYFVQLGIGAFIHWVKDPLRIRRPVQNYVHAVFGLLIIALAFYQVYLGFTYEWPESTGRQTPSGVHTAWIVWVVIIPVAYAVGLLLLKPQLAREKASLSNIRMTPTGELLPLTKSKVAK